jgi:hypothetical protein
VADDKYIKELERAIFNWYYGGENAPPEPLFNAVKAGLKNDMQVIVPIEAPKELFKYLGNPEDIKVGDTFSTNEDIGIQFRHLDGTEPGKYFIPIFISVEELNKGDSTLQINQPLQSLFEALDMREDCQGFVLNP